MLVPNADEHGEAAGEGGKPNHQAYQFVITFRHLEGDHQQSQGESKTASLKASRREMSWLRRRSIPEV